MRAMICAEPVSSINSDDGSSVVGRSGPRLTFSLSFTPRISFLVLWTSSLRFLYCRIKFVDLAEIHGCRSVLAILLVGRGPGRRSWEVSQTLALVGAWFVALSVMSSSYDKVRGGSLSFKNGGSLAVKKKSKKSKKGSKSKEAAAEAAALSVGQGIGGDPGGDAKGTYEELFPYESKRQEEGKGRSNCWGTNYRQAPDVLHGYTTSWKGKKREEMTHEERLDLRCGSKADKFAK